MTPALSDGICDNYTGLSWKPRPGVDELKAHTAIRKKVADMIKDSSFLALVRRRSPFICLILTFDMLFRTINQQRTTRTHGLDASLRLRTGVGRLARGSLKIMLATSVGLASPC